MVDESKVRELLPFVRQEYSPDSTENLRREVREAIMLLRQIANGAVYNRLVDREADDLTEALLDFEEYRFS